MKPKSAEAARNTQKGTPTQDGIGPFCHLAGLFGQRLYFYNRTKRYTDKLKIDSSRCIGCGQCAAVCPMKNITLVDGSAKSGERCTSAIAVSAVARNSALPYWENVLWSNAG